MPSWRCLHPGCPEDTGWRYAATPDEADRAAHTHNKTTTHGVMTSYLDHEEEGT